MIIQILWLMMVSVLADPSWKWSNATQIVEKHEFYENNEIIIKPKNSWQTLFAILYKDTNLQTSKDCIFYQVPGDAPGILKIKTIKPEEKCETYLFRPGDEEWNNLKALQYSIKKNFLTMSLTDSQYQILRWDVPLFNIFENPKPKAQMSSAEYRSPRMIFLKPSKGVKEIVPEKNDPQEDNRICHQINDDCKEISPSTCSQCPTGWYEVPNGCGQGPKYCGTVICGTRNQPACRRGMIYQREEKKFKCQEDSSFAYCSKGLSIQCNGSLPYCI